MFSTLDLDVLRHANGLPFFDQGGHWLGVLGRSSSLATKVVAPMVMAVVVATSHATASAPNVLVTAWRVIPPPQNKLAE
jgi:hypothetical protein